MEKTKILVVAFKFNDVLYASATDEFSRANERHLLVFNDRVDIGTFPLLGEFAKVFSKKIKKDRLAQLFAALSVLTSGQLDGYYNQIIIANPFILITKLIISKIRSEDVILVEDGAMNYYRYKENRFLLKELVERFLFVGDTYKKITSTYLVSPERAFCYFGRKRRIDVAVVGNWLSCPPSLIDRLTDKKILVGGGVIEFLDKDKKKSVLEKVVRDNGVQIYIPHHAHPEPISGVENIFISDFGVTLECMLPLIGRSELYTFGSSVALHAKAINADIRTVFFKLSGFNFIDSAAMFYELMESSVDSVVVIDQD